MQSLEERPWLKWALILASWTALVLVFATQSYLYSTTRGQPTSWVAALLWACSEWYTWAALSPLVLWLAHRFRVERQGWLRALLVHSAAGIFFSLLQPAIQATVKYVGLGGDLRPRPFSEILFQLLLTKIHINFLTYWVIVGISHAAEYYRRYRDRERTASQLEALLTQAQLHALKMQLHPHFLFNALNSISSLIDEDPRKAQKMVARLGDFLRLTLKNSGNQETSLRQELEFLKSYLEIEMFRFEDRLAVHLEIDPQSLEARVPNLILQPIVENALRHGIARKEEMGRIEILAKREGSLLLIQVVDNGPGLAKMENRDDVFAKGVGLANTRERLRNLFGLDHRFELTDAPEGGLIVTFEIPFVKEAVAAYEGTSY